MDSYIRYAGFADKNYKVKGLENWFPIEDTEEAIKQAIDIGYTAISYMSYEFEPEDEQKIEPNRRGNLFIDIDSKRDPKFAFNATKYILRKLIERFKLDLRYIRCWLSGSKGCHLEIPSYLYGDKKGHPYLPKIHRLFLNLILLDITYRCGFSFSCKDSIDKMIDKGIYNMGKGRLIRFENTPRKNIDRFKVPVYPFDIVNKEFEELWELTRKPQSIELETDKEQKENDRLTELFNTALNIFQFDSSNGDIINILESLSKCSFVEYCFSERRNLDYKKWFAILSIFSEFGVDGKKLAHYFSKDYPKYSEKETNDQFNASLKSKPRCDYINKLDFNCNNSCCVKDISSPVELHRYSKSSKFNESKNFYLNEDGLYYSKKGDNQVKVSNWIKIIARLASENDDDYSYLVKFKTDTNTYKEIRVSWIDLVAKNDKLVQGLVYNGFRTYGEYGASLVKKFFTTFSDDVPGGVLVYRTGWTEDNKAFILTDKQIGNTEEKVIFCETKAETLIKESGSLNEWKENVAELCTGNDILIFCLSFGFVAPLIKILDIESFGINLMGTSSSGKSTTAIVVGSIYGGGSKNNKGYINQWRATDNAIEFYAEASNDTLIVLDELSQATPEAVYNTVYMLSNGKGRARCNKDLSVRKTATWRTALFSTGELSIDQKILESNKLKPLAGLDVRIINLQINSEAESNSFSELHGYNSPSEFADRIASNAKTFYGTAFIEFIKKLCSDMDNNINILNDLRNEFINEFTFKDLSGQVARVVKNFASIYAAGTLANKFNIIHFDKETIKRVTNKYLNKWIKARSGLEDKEIILMKERIINYFNENIHLFIDIKTSLRFRPKEFPGFYWVEEGIKFYMIKSSAILKELRGNFHRNIFENILQKLGWILLNSNGNPMISKSDPQTGRNVGGLVFIPSIWDPESTVKHQDMNKSMMDQGNLSTNVDELFLG